AGQSHPPSGAPAGVQLPALTPRPGYVVGRAVFADGRPIPDFEVRIVGVGPAGVAKGVNGQYAAAFPAPNILVSQFTATATVVYHNMRYVLPLHPIDNTPERPTPNGFTADVRKGVVRDYVLALSGVRPRYQPAQPVSTSDDERTAGDFYGQRIW